MFNLKRKVLFGASVSMVLAMAVGSFALGEGQTPASPRSVEAQSLVGATAGPFTVEGGTQGTDFDYASPVLTIHSGDLTISTSAETNERIVVDGAATITLEGVNINTSTGSALQIQDNAAFDVNILLADGSTNILKTTKNRYAGLQKNGSGDNIGALTIGVPSGSAGTGKLEATGGYNGAGIGDGGYESTSNITINGGEITAVGGRYGAGIGGGIGGSGSNITISGGVVEAYAGKCNNLIVDSAGIGAGYNGSAASGNSISGNAVVMVASAGSNIDALRDCDFTNGITFKGHGETFDTGTGRVETVKWDTTSGNMLGNVTLSQDVNIPVDLTIPAGQTLSIKEEKEVTLSEESGAKWTVEGTLQNDGTVTLPDDLTCNDNGIVTTKTNFYLEGQTTIYKTGYQTYQNSTEVQKYTNLPNPDDPTLLKNSLNTDRFAYWYYLDEDGEEVEIKDGDDGSDVLLNQHDFYESREETHTITTSKQGEGEISTNVTEAYEGDEVTFTVSPAEGYQLQENSLKVMAGTTAVAFTDKGEGKYSFTMPATAVQVSAVFEPIPEPEPIPDPSIEPGHGGDGSSKTGDSFAGIATLAILGLATMGTILTRKRR